MWKSNSRQNHCGRVLHGGRLNKARKGTLVQMLPVDLVPTRNGRVTLDPHIDVQTTVRTVFEQFEQLGSGSAVLRYFRDHDLLMPRPITSGEDQETLVWRRASHAAIYLTLTNPAYARAFAFGRRPQAAGRVPGGATPRTWLPGEGWQVLVPDVYPAYIILGGCISKNWQGWEKPEAFKDKADKNSMNSTQQTLVRTWLPRN